MTGLRPVIAAACLGLGLPPTAAVSHYERPPCQADEVEGEVLGLSGYVCAPRCAEGSYDCPGDVPDLAASRPQCMLKDADLGAFCALLCTVDSQCPTSARCDRLQQAGVGVCMYPLSFTDWVRQGQTRRLSYGLPPRADKKIPPGLVQKAVAAVQSLKSKYGIQDGDQDVVAVKDFLTSLSGGAASGAAGAAPMSGTVAIPGMPPGLPAAPQQPAVQTSALDPTLNVYRNDLSYHTNRMSEGIPGLQREVTDAVYLAEHMDQRYAASDLLRHVIEIFSMYLIVGMAYKHQALGARGIDMVPHIGFWMEYPQLIQDGVKYTQEIAGGYLGYDPSSFASSSSGFGGGGGGGGGFMPLDSRERDSFANFEPSK